MNADICFTLTRLIISDCYGDECIMTLLNLMVFEVREQSLKFSLDGMSPISLTNSSSLQYHSFQRNSGVVFSHGESLF